MQSNGIQRDDRIDRDDFDDYVTYADGDGTVIADRRNPSAWVRSTDARPCVR